MTKTVEVWCCGVAADHELGETNVEVYASEEDCYAARICSRTDPDNCAPRKITATFEIDWIPQETTGEAMTLATQIVHWPGKDTPACDKHATQLRGMAGAMGFNVSSTIALGYEIPCANCANEEAKNVVAVEEKVKA